MSIVSRPTKTGGNTTYVDEVAANNKIIKAAEVDGDFNTIYNDYNGNVTNANIAPTAAIATSKLAVDGGITTGHLADNAVTSAKIADGTIVAADLANDAVTTAKILDGAVTLAKMAVGSAVRYAEGPNDETTQVVTTIEGDVLTFAARTPAGATAITTVSANINGALTCTSAGGLQVSIRLKRNGTTIATARVNAAVPASTAIVPFNASISVVQALLTVAQTYTVTAVIEAGSTGTWSAAVTSAYGALVEHA